MLESQNAWNGLRSQSSGLAARCILKQGKQQRMAVS